MSATFLVTGFEPFREHRTNSSWDALEQLQPSWPAHVVAVRLPVDHHAALAALQRSFAAGRYVCESTYWSLLTYADARCPTFAGFLHVPHESSAYPIARIAGAVGNVITARLAALPEREKVIAPELR